MIIILPLYRRPKCDFLSCINGIGSAGNGQCHGLWWWTDCPDFEDEEEALKGWEDKRKTPKFKTDYSIIVEA